MKHSYIYIFLFAFSLVCQVQAQRISVHDPVMIKQGDTYYLFNTGLGISVWSSTDLQNWKSEKPIFSNGGPQWAADTIPRYRGHIWAPDISFHNGQYYVYYSVSAFGKNTSAIGVATNKTLNPADPAFEWVDHGMVICSNPGVDNWNAIDPNLIYGDDGEPYLVYGSFWDGMQLLHLNKALDAPAPGAKPVTIASRKTNRNPENPPSIDNNPVDAGGNAIEAPFIYKHGNYYYFLASIDYCCKGVESTYKMIYGRSEKVTGPYLDKEGKDLLLGGGSILMQGDANWYGTGHNGMLNADNKDYLIFHAYDAADNGRSKLRIFQLNWDKENWPVVGEPIY